MWRTTTMVDNDRIHYGINIFSLSEQSLVSRLAALEQVVKSTLFVLVCVFHERNELFQQTLIAVELFTIRKSETLKLCETKEIFVFFETRQRSLLSAPFRKQRGRYIRRRKEKENYEARGDQRIFCLKKWRLIKLAEADG